MFHFGCQLNRPPLLPGFDELNTLIYDWYVVLFNSSSYGMKRVWKTQFSFCGV